MTDFERAIRALSDAGVDFVIIGGVSASLHGSAYVTVDLDVCFSRSRANLKRIVDALAPFHPRPRGFPVDLPFLWEVGTLNNATLFTLATDIGDLDLLTEVAGVGTYEDAKASSTTKEAFGRRVATLKLSSLIRSKRAAGRPKDLLLIPELESLLEATGEEE